MHLNLPLFKRMPAYTSQLYESLHYTISYKLASSASFTKCEQNETLQVKGIA